MGRITQFAQQQDVTSPSPSPLSEALLFTTICIVGHPVEVHIKDGSVYSGIFHTASLHYGFGVALKKARMIKKGTCNANVPNEGLVETLVVLSEDLVQVVAKGIMLPPNAAPSAASHDNEEAVSRPIDGSQSSENGAIVGELVTRESQGGVGKCQEEEDGRCYNSGSVKEASEANGSSPSVNGHCSGLNVQREHHMSVASNQLANDTSSDSKLVNQVQDGNLPKEFMRTTESTSDSGKPESDADPSCLTIAAEMVPQNPIVTRTTKESKLNPGAKVFSPSLPNMRSTPPLVPTVVPSMAYVVPSNNIPSVQVAPPPPPQPEVGVRPIAPRPSWPIKVFPFVNTTPTNADTGLQYTQPIAGHIAAARPQPIRNGAQFQPIQALPPYIHPNPQNAMFGRPGQVVYVHSITHDMVQGPAALSQGPHPFLAPHPIHVAKHEGVLGGQALPVSATPPLVSHHHVPQPFAMPSHIQQLSQPVFSSMIPVPVLTSNLPYAPKFP